MKTTTRFSLFGAFAAGGVGLAICVGLSADSRPKPTPPNDSQLYVEARVECPPSQTGNAAPTPEIKPQAGSAIVPTTALQPIAARTASLPQPTSSNAATVDAAVAYGQESVPPPPPTPSAGNLPGVLDVLRKGLLESPPAPSEPATTPRGRTTVDGGGDGKLRIHIYDEDIRRVLELLSEQGHLNILASKSVEGKVSASLSGVDVDSALAAILKSTGYVSRRDGNFIFVGLPEDFKNIEQALDRVSTRVYRTNYVSASELKTLVEPLLTERTGVVSISTASETGIGSSDSVAGGDKFAGAETLVVRDYEAVLAQVDQLVAEVDVRPPQVAIEAMILSVELSDEDKFGVNFQLLRNNPNISFGLGSPPTSLSATDFPLDGGLKFGFLDSNLGAFLEALETVGDTNVVANPRLMVLNKQRAEIQIGKQEGYVNQTITQTSSSQSIEFLDTGTQLRLRPFISSDGIVRLEVRPELSDGTVELRGGFTLPNKKLTQVTTNIMVKDGCTVIIGGLIREQLTNTTTQIPVLGNLPFIGFAFRQTSETVGRQEVIVLLTPRIVYEPGTCREGEQTACEYLRRQSTYSDKMSPFGKRSIARRYYRLAERAYAEGDMDKALRFAEMSVQFDPLDRAGLELRTNIWLGKPCNGGGQAGGQADVNPLEGDGVANWLIEDLENPPQPLPVPHHPLDPGTPGGHRDLVQPRVLQ